MAGRHPVAFLFLELPPDQVDVNVHPTKAEVRFRDSDALAGLVQQAVRDRLRAEDLTARLRPPAAQPQASAARVTGEPPGVRLPAPAPAPQAELPLFTPPGEPGSGARPGLPAPQPAPSVARGSGPQAAQAPRAAGTGQEGKEAEAGPPAVKAVQMHDLYLLVEVPEGILVIDQHALHERILFERFREQLTAGRVETQGLLIPETVSLPPAQAALVLAHREALAELGLGVEDFGSGTVLLTGYPAVLGKRSPGGLLQGVGDYLTAKERVPTREALLNDLLSLMACHAAVRAGDRLTQTEIDALVAQRHLARDSHHCPHGRPTSLLFTRQDLDRQFRRV
jgi:DNA mismatch repair protein MutL